MAYATPDELAAFLELPSINTARATLVLQSVADAIDSEVGFSLGHQELVGVLVDGTGAAQIVLPGFPVTAVSSVEVLGRDLAWTALTESVDYTWATTGVLTRVYSAADPQGAIEPAWPGRPQSVRVSYTCGPAGAPPGVAKTLNLTAAARLWINPGSLQGERVGGMDLRYSAKGDMGWTPWERRQLDRLSDIVIA